MAVDTSIIGKPTSARKVRVERGPVEFFAKALHDDNPVFHDAGAAAAAGFPGIPAPPTFSFVMGHQGSRAEEQPPDPTGGQNPMFKIMGDLMSKGGIVLHGEQEFVYHRTIVEGDVLSSQGRIADVYEKESKGSVMTFIVVETEWTDESGDPVVTERFNLIHRRKAEG